MLSGVVFVFIVFALRKKRSFLEVLSVRSSTLKLGGAGGKKNILTHRFENDCFHRRHRSGCTFLFVVLIHVYVIPTPRLATECRCHTGHIKWFRILAIWGIVKIGARHGVPVPYWAQQVVLVPDCSVHARLDLVSSRSERQERNSSRLHSHPISPTVNIQSTYSLRYILQ